MLALVLTSKPPGRHANEGKEGGERGGFSSVPSSPVSNLGSTITKCIELACGLIGLLNDRRPAGVRKPERDNQINEPGRFSFVLIQAQNPRR